MIKINIPRKEPLRDIECPQVVNLSERGLSEGGNLAPPLMSVLEEIRGCDQGVRITMAPGSYVLEDVSGNRNACLEVSGLENVVIDGAGSELTVLSPKLGVLRLMESRRVIIRNFTIDYDPLTWTQGTISDLDCDAGTFMYATHEGYPSLETEYISNSPEQWGIVRDPEHPVRLKTGSLLCIDRGEVQKTGDGLFRVFLPRKQQMQFLDEGDVLIFYGRYNGNELFYVKDSSDITFDSITNYASPTGNYLVEDSDAVNILSCRIVVKGGRIHSANADGVHCRGARIGPWVEDCTFEGLSDDGINLYQKPNFIRRICGEYTFIVEEEVLGRVRPGDEIEFFSPKTGAVLGESKISSIDRESAEVTVRDPLPALVIGDEQADDHFYNLSASSSNFVIRNCRFKDIRRNGVTMRSSNGLIEGNRFDGLSDAALCIKNEPDWPEGHISKDIVFRDNDITSCGFSWNFMNGNGAVVSVGLEKLGENAVPEVLEISGITIADNRIDCLRGPAVSIRSAKQCSVVGNTIRCPAEKCTDSHLVDVRETDDMTVSDNECSV